MNALSGAGVLAENRLFATLDATTRTVVLDGNKQVLLSDTVGFIRKLPHKLIESFKSTLDETREADMLLHVVDASHPRFEDHIAVVRETIREIGADDRRALLVFNKVDAIEELGLLTALREEHPDAVFVSALRGVGLDELRRRMIETTEENFEEHTVVLPLSEGGAISHVRRVAEVLDEEYLYAAYAMRERWREGEPNPPIAAVRLTLRIAPTHAADLAPTFARHRALTPVPDGAAA